MERALPGDRPFVGVTHSEGMRTVRTVFHWKQDVPHAHAHEECVTLLLDSRFFPEGEAFPAVVRGGWPSC
jgi:hypothetical protein